MLFLNKYGSFIKRSGIFALLTICLLAIQACGLPGEAGGTSGQSNNQPGSGTGEQAQGETPKFKGLILNVERLNGDNDLSKAKISFESITANLVETSILGNLPQYLIEFSELANNIQLKILDTDYVEQVNHVIKISFGSGETYYAPIPLMPEVDDDTQVTAQVTANVFTHYVVNKLMSTLTDPNGLDSTILDSVSSNDALKLLLPCESEDPLIDCSNQPRAKQIHFHNLGAMASRFNIDLSSQASVSDALVFLGQQADFTKQIDRGIYGLIRDESPFTRGTYRETGSSALGLDAEGNPLVTNIPQSEFYNSAFFAMSLGQTEDSQISAFSVSSSTISDKASELPTYPSYQSTAFMNEMYYESGGAIDLPYERKLLEIGGLNDQSSNLTLVTDEPVNSLSSAVTRDSFLSTHGFIQEARTVNQTIPAPSSSNPVGWEYNPYFVRLYKVNETLPAESISSKTELNSDVEYGNEATWLTAANHFKNEAYSLSGADSDSPAKITKIEDLHSFSWEIHGLESSTSTDSETGSVSSNISSNIYAGKEYGTVSLGVKLAQSGKVVEVIGDVAKWATTGSTVAVTQAASSNFYQSYRLTLNEDGTVIPVTPEKGTLDSVRAIGLETTTVANTNHEGGTSELDLGRISLDDGSETPLGHITENGNYMAFAFNTSDSASISDRGNGIILASRLTDEAEPELAALADARQNIYQIQGNLISIANSELMLQNWNDSKLKLNLSEIGGQDCRAELSLQRLYVKQVTSEEASTVQDAVIESSLVNPVSGRSYQVVSTNCQITQNEISIEFSDAFGETLKLDGFFSQPDSNANEDNVSGNLLTLMAIQENGLGLLLGMEQQDLEPDFSTTRN